MDEVRRAERKPVAGEERDSLLTRAFDFVFANRAFLIQFLIAAGVLILVALVSTAWSLHRFRITSFLLAIPVVVVGVLVMEKRLWLAPPLILFFACFVPLYLPTGTSSILVDSLVLSLGFSALWILRMILVTKRYEIAPSPVNKPVMGFMLVSVISLVWSFLFADPNLQYFGSFHFVQLASTLVMVISPFVLLLIGNLTKDTRTLRAMVWMIIVVQLLGMISAFGPVRLPVNAAGLAPMWMIAFSTAIVVTDRSTPLVVRAGLALLLAATIYAQFVVNLSWIAGWLPGLVAGGVVLFLRSKKLFVVAVALLVVYVVMNYDVFYANFLAESATSGDTRIAAWITNWQFTKKHLLFGMGPAGYVAYYMTYIPMDAMATHSNYIDILSQTGITGFAFYLAIFFTLAWRGWVVYRRLRGRGDFLEAVSQALLGGWCGVMVIMGFGDWLIPFAYTQTIAGFDYTIYSWIFLGLILTLDFMTRPARSVE